MERFTAAAIVEAINKLAGNDGMVATLHICKELEVELAYKAYHYVERFPTYSYITEEDVTDIALRLIAIVIQSYYKDKAIILL